MFVDFRREISKVGNERECIGYQMKTSEGKTWKLLLCLV